MGKEGEWREGQGDGGGRMKGRGEDREGLLPLERRFGYAPGWQLHMAFY